MSLSTVRIRDSYADFEGNPISGEVRFYPTADVETSDGENLLRTSRPIVAPLVDGNLDITLIATDDDSLTPSGWAYYVVEDFEHRPARRPYAIFAPAGELELSDVTPVEPVAEMAAYVRTVNGQKPDDSGNVNVTASVGSVEWSAVTERPSVFPPEDHTHTLEDLPELTATLSALTDDLAAADHGHAISDVSGLQAALDAKASATHDHAGVYAPASHDHDGVYAPRTHSHPEYAPADHGHSEYAAVSHTHEIADVTGLRTELDDLAEAVEGLETGSGFLTQEEADGLYAASGHNHDALYASVTHNHDGVYAPAAHAHSVADLTDLDLSGKADVDHGHDIADVSGLQSALDGKAAAGHNHDAAYAALGHDHDGRYALADHDHDGDYAPASHTHPPRVGSVTSSATPAINTDAVEFFAVTALATDITGFSLSGTPVEAQKLWIAITGTASRAITWGSGFEASTVALPTTTDGTNRLDVGFIYNGATGKWRCVAVA